MERIFKVLFQIFDHLLAYIHEMHACKMKKKRDDDQRSNKLKEDVEE